MEIKLKACAKINLALDILGKRKDGYHLVDMVMQSVSLYDIVSIKKNNEKKINIKTNKPEIPTDESNTVYKATKRFFEYVEKEVSGFDIFIEKNIPSCAGLAGGSADAAATLVGLNYFLDEPLNIADLVKIAEKVGADVPFCLLGGAMLCTGIGTTLTALEDIDDCFIVIAKPSEQVKTENAYRLCDSCDKTYGDKSQNIITAIKTGNLKLLGENLFNKFEDVLNISSVENIKRVAKSHNALGASMTGSGSAVFAIFEKEEYAHACIDHFKQSYDDVFLTKPTQRGIYFL